MEQSVWSSPLKQPKAPKAPKEEVIKKIKPRVSKPAAKAIVKVKTMDDLGAIPAMNVVEQIRKQYKAAFFNTEEEDSFQFLLDAVEKDPILKSNPLLNPDE